MDLITEVIENLDTKCYSIYNVVGCCINLESYSEKNIIYMGFSEICRNSQSYHIIQIELILPELGVLFRKCNFRHPRDDFENMYEAITVTKM